MKSPRLRLSSPFLPVVLRFLDAGVIVLAGFIALELRAVSQLGIELPEDLRSYHSLILGGGVLFLLFSGEIYRSWRATTLSAMLLRVSGHWLLTIALLLGWLFLSKASEDYSRLWFLLWAVLGVISLWLFRTLAYLALRRLRRAGFNLKHVVLIGQSPSGELLKKRIQALGWTGFTLRAHLEDPSPQALEALVKEPPHEIWLAFSLSDTDRIHSVIHALRHCATTLRLAPDWLAFRLINHGITDVAGVPMIDLSASPLTGAGHLLKLVEDKVLSLLFLVLAAPLMVLIALGIKLSSKGPVFYRQERIGLNNRPFMMLKFRSMPVDVEKGDIRWGAASEKVATPFGRFIRRTSLDELPQFINVLRGEMSIVGPRPERPAFVDRFKDEIPDYMQKHLMKAGITGWAQVNGWRGDTDLRPRIEHDLYYIEHWSLWFDLKIILLTALRVLSQDNAR